MSDQRETIIDIKINAKEAIENIKRLREAQNQNKSETAEAKKEIKDLEEAIKKQGGATAEQAKRMDELKTQVEENIISQKQYNSAISDNQKILASSINANELQSDSIKEMRKNVASLTQQWEMLSGEERAGAKGKAMQEKLADLNGQINEASLSVKNFKDNIGNYRSAMEGFTSTNSIAGKVLGSLGVDGSKLSGIIGTNLVDSLGSMNMAMKALSANPLMMVLTALVAVLMAVWSAVEKNQQAMDALNRITAPTKKLFEGVAKILGVVAGLVAGLIEKTLSLFGTMEDGAVKAVKIRQQLEQEEIGMITKRAKQEQEIADLQDKQAQKQTYTHKERIAMAERIAEIRNEQMKQDEEIARKELEAWDLEHENMELTRAELKERAELESKLINIKTQVLKVQKEQTAYVDGAIQAIKAETKAIEEQQRKATEAYNERLRMQKELTKKTAEELEDILLGIMADGEEKELAQLSNQFARQIEAVKNRLATEKNLTEESRNNLNAMLLALEEDRMVKEMEIQAKYSQARDEQYIAEQVEKMRVDAEMAGVAFEAEMARKADETALKLEQRRQELDNELLFRQENEKNYNEWLLNLDEATKGEKFRSQEAYELAVLESNNRLKESEQAVADDMQRQAIMRVQAMGSIAGSLGSMISNLADKSQAGSVFAKALALTDIATNTGVAIAGAVKSGAGVPFPGNLLAIATGVGSVASGVASAKSALSSQMPKKPAILGSSRAQSIPMPTTGGAGNVSIATELGAVENRARQQQALQDSQQAPVIRVVDIIDATEAVKMKETKY